MAVIELVDYNDIKPKDSKKRSGTRRAGKSTKTTSSGTDKASASTEKETKKSSSEEE